MMDELQDVKNMSDFINNQKSSYQHTFQLEFHDFVNFKLDCYSDQEFDDDEIIHNDFKTVSYSLKESPEQVPALTLTEEEQNLIDSCTDPVLKKLLFLNRLKNIQLIKIHKKIQELLLQCEIELEQKNNMLISSEPKHFSQQPFVWKLAAPYFKDTAFFPSPLNEDAVEKRNRCELSIYDLIPSPKWTPIEFDRLFNAVKCNFNINRQTKLVSTLKALKSQISDEDVENRTKLEEIFNLKKELDKVKEDVKVPPLNSNEYINWYKVSETFLKDKHTPLECQSVWHMLIHPQINKLEWSEEENKKLEEIARRYSYQKWDLIAAELKNNRTEFTTCLHYFSKLCDKFKKSKFTSEEDSFLLEVVDSYKIGNFIPWNKVVCHFNNRSRHQLYHRYTYFLSQNHVKRGKFSEAEDVLLIILVNKFGRNFKKCADYMPHRSQVQLKSRYNSNLQRNIKKGTFTDEEDKIIYEYAQDHGEKNWSGLRERLKRCNAQIRQRYKLIKTFLLENPNSQISDIPKRKHRFNEVSDEQYSFLNYIADLYKSVDKVPTLTMIEESLQTESISSLHESSQNKLKKGLSRDKLKSIDAMLTNFFSNAMNTKQTKNLTETNLTEAARNAEEILSLFGANLYKVKNLQCSSHLDNIDLEVLERLFKKKANLYLTSEHKLIPPSVDTLVGLRSLIMKHKEYKQRYKDNNKDGSSKSDKVLWSVDQSLMKLGDSIRNEVLFHMELFSKRFAKIFDWSAVLSLEKPYQYDVLEVQKNTNQLEITRNKRSSKKDNFLGVKRRKVDIADLANLSQVQNQQLKLVDKKFIEQLMKTKNNVNIIRIETVTNSAGSVKPILRPIHTSNTTESISNDSAMINEINYNDVEDVKKLNVVLKTVKSEIVKDSSSSEYQAIRSDVQLLKEILKYEKVTIKTDPDG